MLQSIASSNEPIKSSSPVKDSNLQSPILSKDRRRKAKQSQTLEAERELKKKEMIDQLREFRERNEIVEKPGDNQYLYTCQLCDRTVEILQVVQHMVEREHLKNRIAQREANQPEVERAAEPAVKESELKEMAESENIKVESKELPKDTNKKIEKKNKSQAIVDNLKPLMKSNRIVKKEFEDSPFLYYCNMCRKTVGLGVIQTHVEGRKHQLNSKEWQKWKAIKSGKQFKETDDKNRQVKRKLHEDSAIVEMKKAKTDKID